MARSDISAYVEKLLEDESWQTGEDKDRKARLNLAIEMMATANVNNWNLDQMFMVVEQMVKVT